MLKFLLLSNTAEIYMFISLYRLFYTGANPNSFYTQFWQLTIEEIKRGKKSFHAVYKAVTFYIGTNISINTIPSGLQVFWFFCFSLSLMRAKKGTKLLHVRITKVPI
ncbi:nuclear transcription factor Y subunit beta [Platysternon megacephalum]|uniref:Nuclear transcription factor Y subunit beta n=1 Tax=Platysternon megacephalum TaxID=55544 RepID=A0A4D9EBL5_9SAUR|nr:nuclear transcription factor Y subunit beta [Platysternon megacephalum]